tara:strand:- start:449 stop:619 length:171 start_codon:yes stop_codon:yes gene_type:complete
VGLLFFVPIGQLKYLTGPSTDTRSVDDGLVTIAEYSSANQTTRPYVHGHGVCSLLV